MANYCENDICWFGYDRESVEKIRQLILLCFKDRGSCSVRDFAMACGYSREEAEKLVDYRDMITDVNDCVSEKEGVFYFYFSTSSAWEPNVSIFYRIINRFFGGSQVYGIEYCSVETGTDIYINSDMEGFFFTDRYYLDCCINDEYSTEYFETKQELLDWLKERFPMAKLFIKMDLHFIEDEVRKYINEDGDDFITIYMYSYD